ncbi:hypothetical protein BDF22DRAFT_739985 [Syncephalis plumigaleata]|nr:hypothetical protein BDF22DRAFT_739985 [Syncephalis plumigaleata]
MGSYTASTSTLLFLVYQLLWCSHVLSGVDAQGANPPGRWGHTATLLGNMVYFIGGKDKSKSFITGNDMIWALNVDDLRDTTSPTWKAISATGTKPPKSLVDHAAGSDKNREQVVVYGGATDDFSNAKALWTFNPGAGVWSASSSSGGPAARLFNMASTDIQGSLYIMGGAADQTTMGSSFSSNSSFTDGMYSLNMNQLSWQKQSPADTTKSTYFQHTISYISDKDMVVSIGGNTGTNMVDMDQVLVYSRKNSVWTAVTTYGTAPPARREHTAVVSGKTIIIYGGCDRAYTTYYDDIWVLDTDTWKWTRKEVLNGPPGRYEHTATMLGDYMLIGFGYTGEGQADDKIYLLDTNNWQYTTKFPGYSLSGPLVGSKANGISSGVIAAIVAGSVVILALAVLGAVVILRRRRQMRERQQHVPFGSSGGAKNNGASTFGCLSWLGIGRKSDATTTTAAANPTPATSPTTAHYPMGAATAAGVAVASGSTSPATRYSTGQKNESANRVRYSTDYPTSVGSKDNAPSPVGNSTSGSQAPLPFSLSGSNQNNSTNSDWTLAPQRPVSPPVAPIINTSRYSAVSSMTETGLSPVPVSKGKSLLDSNGSIRPDSSVMGGTNGASQYRHDNGSSLLGPNNASNQQLGRESWLTNDSFATNDSSGMSSGGGRLPPPAHSPTFRASYSIQEESHTSPPSAVTDEDREAELEALASECNVYIRTGPKQTLRIANPDEDSD